MKIDRAMAAFLLAVTLSGCATNCYTYTYRSSVSPLFDGHDKECPGARHD